MNRDEHIDSTLPEARTTGPTAIGLPGLLGMGREQIVNLIVSMGEPAFRAEQIHRWLYADRAVSFEQMTSLSKGLRDTLASTYRLRTLDLLDTQQSEDGTVKFLFRTPEGYNIETVLIPSEARDDQNEPRRRTVCLSTQVGCPLDCKFCATASMRLKRNLVAGEIIEQFMAVEAFAGEPITNIVYMGMGEPMLNYEEVFGSVGIFTDPQNRLVAPRHITISTAGIPSAIRRMADEGRRVKLALSLHALTNGMRSELMPINRRYNITELMDAIEYYYRRTHLPITYEYILFDGWNDTDADVLRLAKITRRVPSKVNVIPFHQIDFTEPTGIAAQLRAATPERFDDFIRRLREQGVQVMIRSSSGKDIDAACGQLAIRHSETTLSHATSASQ